MAKFPEAWTVADLAAFVGGSIVGDSTRKVSRPGTLFDATPDTVVFAENEEYLSQVVANGIGVALVPTGVVAEGISLVVVESPRAAFGKLLHFCIDPHPVAVGIHPTAQVSPTATVSSEAAIGAFVVIEGGTVIEAGAVIYPFSYVGPNCHIERSVVVYPHAVLMQSVTLRAGAIVHPHAVLGADGFGYTWDGTKHAKVPQVGAVEVGELAEIGACTTVDRATAGTTRIGAGTKLDNLVQVGHNVQVGKHVLIAAQTGISGSAQIGDGVVMAGQCGVAHHVSITSRVTLGGRAAVISDITEPGYYLGYPTRPMDTEKRSMALYGRLPEIWKRLRQIEKKQDSEK
jgi:UDP-3-O-[3-hydroxymyristoyl] glucosamine N-acyltransferase